MGSILDWEIKLKTKKRIRRFEKMAKYAENLVATVAYFNKAMDKVRQEVRIFEDCEELKPSLDRIKNALGTNTIMSGYAIEQTKNGKSNLYQEGDFCGDIRDTIIFNSMDDVDEEIEFLKTIYPNATFEVKAISFVVNVK